jgi:DNA-binding response OmpR family regulator
VRLLVVDDNPLNLELFEGALADDGHEVVVASDGEVGLARALAEPFDVVLLDVQLPGRNGMELCRELRKAGRTGPILAVSANALPDQVARGLDAGFDQYLTKPISPHTLCAVVRSYDQAPLP